MTRPDTHALLSRIQAAKDAGRLVTFRGRIVDRADLIFEPYIMYGSIQCGQGTWHFDGGPRKRIAAEDVRCYTEVPLP